MADIRVGKTKLVVIQGTSFCNLNCRYCYLSEEERAQKSLLDIGLIEPIFKELFTSDMVDKRFRILWHAGEPLSLPINYYKKLFDEIERVSEKYNHSGKKCSHEFQTNGTIINQQWCDFIKEYDLGMGVSLDGPEFIHNSSRVYKDGRGSFKNTMRGIKLLQENGIFCPILTVLTDLALDYPEEMFNFYVENNIQHVSFNVEEKECFNEDSSMHRNVEVLEKKYYAFIKKFWQLMRTSEYDISAREIKKIAAGLFDPDGMDYYMAQNAHINFPFDTITIASNGDFSTYCPELITWKSERYGDFILGNFLRDTLESTLNSEKLLTLYRAMEAGKEECKTTCKYYQYCGGGFAANKVSETGRLDVAETQSCRYGIKLVADAIMDDILECEADMNENLVEANIPVEESVKRQIDDMLFRR